MNLINKSRIVLLVLVAIVIVSSYIVVFHMSGYGSLSLLDSKRLQRHADEQYFGQKHISRMCHTLGLSNRTLDDIDLSQLDHLIVDEAYKLIYCYVPKVACTNWKRILLVLKNGQQQNPVDIRGNDTHAPNLFTTLNQFPISEIQHKLKTYMKFLFVRNPYERLLSVYRNKFEKSFTSYFWERYGRKIIKQYRKNPDKDSLSKGHNVQFEEFLLYVSGLDTRNGGKEFNEHWRPIVDLCLPCIINYDIVGKYERLEEDADYTLWKTGILDIVMFPKREQSYKLQPSSALMTHYYRNISHVLQQKLYHIYRDDFLLFNYTPSVFTPK